VILVIINFNYSFKLRKRDLFNFTLSLFGRFGFLKKAFDILWCELARLAVPGRPECLGGLFHLAHPHLRYALLILSP
jgi:hypothetical protein